MTTDGGFKHIKVAPAEQEVVIHAGVPQKTEPAQPADAVPVAEPEKSAEPEPAHGRTATPRAYQGTTLEDIQSSKMPNTQVAIIVVAVLAIIAFAVWYAFFS